MNIYTYPEEYVKELVSYLLSNLMYSTWSDWDNETYDEVKDKIVKFIIELVDEYKNKLKPKTEMRIKRVIDKVHKIDNGFYIFAELDDNTYAIGLGLNGITYTIVDDIIYNNIYEALKRWETVLYTCARDILDHEASVEFATSKIKIINNGGMKWKT